MQIEDQVENLVRKTLDHEQEINCLIKKVKIFEHCSDLDPFMVKILIAELLWGRFIIKFNTMDTVYVKYFEQDIKEEFLEVAVKFESFEDSYCCKLLLIDINFVYICPQCTSVN